MPIVGQNTDVSADVIARAKIHESPAKHSATIGVVHTGGQVTVTCRTARDWVHVRSAGTGGYIKDGRLFLHGTPKAC
jgi:hypothetical protein